MVSTPDILQLWASSRPAACEVIHFALPCNLQLFAACGRLNWLQFVTTFPGSFITACLICLDSQIFSWKKVFLAILIPSKHIFCHFLVIGTIPSKLKIAKVIPIFKSEDASVVNNYRPISLLRIFTKTLKQIVQTRLIAYLDANNLQYFDHLLNVEMQ
jgi:hypothetical protein